MTTMLDGPTGTTTTVATGTCCCIGKCRNSSDDDWYSFVLTVVVLLLLLLLVLLRVVVLLVVWIMISITVDTVDIIRSTSSSTSSITSSITSTTNGYYGSRNNRMMMMMMMMITVSSFPLSLSSSSSLHTTFIISRRSNNNNNNNNNHQLPQPQQPLHSRRMLHSQYAKDSLFNKRYLSSLLQQQQQQQQYEPVRIETTYHQRNNENDTTTTTNTTTTSITSTTTNIIIHNHNNTEHNTKCGLLSPLSMSLMELSDAMDQRSGRALLIWDCYKYGIDPIVYYNNNNSINSNSTTTTTTTGIVHQHSNHNNNDDDDNNNNQQLQPTWKFPSRRRHQTLGTDALRRLSELYQNCHTGSTSNHRHRHPSRTNNNSHHNTNNLLWRTSTSSSTGSTGSTQMSSNSNTNRNDDMINNRYDNNNNNRSTQLLPPQPQPPQQQYHRIDTSIAKIAHVSQSTADGTIKLLLTLCYDNTQIETVLIPFYDNDHNNNNKNSRCTICISSQVGCQQQCTFCATGTMGKTRSLSSDEILVQFFYAQQIYYHTSTQSRRNNMMTSDDDDDDDNTTTTTTNNNNTTMIHYNIPPITNVVFMGMGEPSDNADAVNIAVRQLTTRELYQLSGSKITVSTVAPNPQSFMKFVNTSCVLAWSVHAVSDPLRKLLVPSTRYTMHELRQGLIDTLLLRPNNYLRTVMIEVVLIDELNDSIQHAMDMAIFVRGIVDAVPGCKIMVNLIPYNDINSHQLISHTAQLYRKPTMERIVQYQKQLWSDGVYTHIRGTRGDDENAACGQLVVTKQQQRRNNNNNKAVTDTAEAMMER